MRSDPGTGDVKQDPFADTKTLHSIALPEPPLPGEVVRELPYVVQEEPFGSVPSTLIAKTGEIYPEMKHYGQVDFVAVGMGGAWVIGVMGKLCFWDKVEATVVKKLASVYSRGESLRVCEICNVCARSLIVLSQNVVLSPVQADIYFIEARDASVHYHVPDEWHAKMKLHFTPENALDLEAPFIHKSSSFLSRFRRSTTPVPNAQQPQAGNVPPPYLPFSTPANYNAVNTSTLFQTTFPSSGVMQTQPKQSVGKEIAVALIKSTPAIIGAAVGIVSIAGSCTIM
jgi:hypothetical protein